MGLIIVVSGSVHSGQLVAVIGPRCDIVLECVKICKKKKTFVFIAELVKQHS